MYVVCEGVENVFDALANIYDALINIHDALINNFLWEVKLLSLISFLIFRRIYVQSFLYLRPELHK